MIYSAPYLLTDWPAPKKVRAFTSLRGTHKHHGYSQNRPLSFLNLKYQEAEPQSITAQNYQRLQHDWNWDSAPPLLEQKHGHHVHAYRSHTDITHHGTLPEGDACWTDQTMLPCLILTADCLPVLFCSKTSYKVAAAHAGWRGLLAGVLENTVKAMNLPSHDLLVWLGPGISPACFEVGSEVRALFIKKDQKLALTFLQVPSNPHKWHFDLYKAAQYILNRLGIDAIYGGQYCTFQQQDWFYSYRRDQITGRMATAIWLTE